LPRRLRLGLVIFIPALTFRAFSFYPGAPKGQTYASGLLPRALYLGKSIQHADVDFVYEIKLAEFLESLGIRLFVETNNKSGLLLG